IEACYARADEQQIAIIEMAAASGLDLLEKEERNPLYTSSYGTGELIKDALNHGAKTIILGIGGSATNDGGTGMLSALGVKFT
ncbi:glycerate kinase, partial [Bacillus thuringiensis]